MPRFRLKALMFVIAAVAVMLAAVNHSRRAARLRAEQEAFTAYYRTLQAAQQKTLLRQAPMPVPPKPAASGQK